MPTNGLQPPLLVRDTAGLEQMVEHLNAQTAIAVDTESNSLHAYQEKVCLIQISSPDLDFLVDPLFFNGLDALGVVFSDPKIQKVFHAGEYDLACLKRDYSFTFENIFDTLIAATALGESNLGLAGLLEKYLGVHVEKKFQKADWGKRPIKPEMLIYAQEDSHYLLRLRDMFVRLLTEKDRLVMVMEDSTALAHQTPPMKNHVEDLWKVRGRNGMMPKALSLLKKLNHMREDIARKQDLPPFKILSDRALVEISQIQPGHIEELSLLSTLSRGQVKRYGWQIMREVENWRKDPKKVERSRPARMDEDIIKRRELLGEWRKQVGLSQGLPSNVILPKDLLESIAEQPLTNRQELRVAMAFSPSRYEKFGDEILKLLERGYL